MKLLTLMALVSVGGALVASPASAEPVSIKKLAFAGSGCAPSEGLMARLADLDRDGLPERFNLAFSDYVAKLGPGSSILDQRRNCNLILSLNLPKGWQYTIRSVRYDGFASLPGGVRGLQQSTYQFLFASRPATLEDVLRGHFIGSFQRQDQLKPEEWVWSPCRVAIPLALRTQVLLLGPTTRSAILRATKQSYGLAWRRCK
jgi:hypothetical protein